MKNERVTVIYSCIKKPAVSIELTIKKAPNKRLLNLFSAFTDRTNTANSNVIKVARTPVKTLISKSFIFLASFKYK